MTPPRDRKELETAMARAACRYHYGCPRACDCSPDTSKERTYLAALEAAGCRVVPVVATDAMCDAAATAGPDDWEDDPIACRNERRELRGIYGLMAGASPYAPEPEK